MPRIFDNIDQELLEAITYSATKSYRADFCVGYFNLRGWRLIGDKIDHFSGQNEECCRVLIGMQKLPSARLYDELKISYQKPFRISNEICIALKQNMAREFRKQLMVGVPTLADEKGLQKLRRQLLSKKVIIKLHCSYNLHAKLYLFHKQEKDQPIIGYLGSSNLTLSGLKYQGELNIDVTDQDATRKLKEWFDERWQDRFCLDISQELAHIINESWAREDLIPPYHIYLKMAYHLSQSARDGLAQYSVPSDFDLFDFQSAAVRIAAHHLNRQGGVIIGDVVGLGKTMVGSAIARIMQDDFGISTLIICPANLVPMWENYRDQYGLQARVLSIGKVEKELPNIPARFRLVLIDESHNLRNREGKRYSAIKDYIEQSNSRCILLTATPYNKTFLDLSAQLRLFIREDQDLGIKPNKLINNINFALKYPNISPTTLSAFEKSEYSEDWQELMSRYMVRRTRSFIRNQYGKTDPKNNKKYLEFSNGKRSYFPQRIPKTATFILDENDPYSQLYSAQVVDIIGNLTLPRYALGTYELDRKNLKISPTEKNILDSLSRAGTNLIGFCRTNLFKRLESSGYAFIQSIERHILRNYIYLYAIETEQNIPIGAQDVDFLNTAFNDQDSDSTLAQNMDIENENNDNIEDLESFEITEIHELSYQQKAQKVYQTYQTKYKKRFKWLSSKFFDQDLAQNLREDAHNLLKILTKAPHQWNSNNDQKLLRLWHLLTEEYPDEKVLIFSQFADTVNYLGAKLKELGLTQFATVTGNTDNPSALTSRFSPKSNNKKIESKQELRVLIATDVLSEGQNLQDCRIIVNYDLPWAIIRLIQRAGRIDRIGQEESEILCYSFLPADGVEELINLRGRLKNRLKENAEVVGTDEVFFEEGNQHTTLDLYHEKSGILDDIEDLEVDLVSEALSIWEEAQQKYPQLTKQIEEMPNVVYSTRQKGIMGNVSEEIEGVLMYLRTVDGVDALAYVDKDGNSVTQSQSKILKLARCEYNTPPINRHPLHYELVEKGTEIIAQQQKNMIGGGRLGSPNGARAKVYERLNNYILRTKEKTPLLMDTLEWQNVQKALEDIYNYPLRESATLKLHRQLKSGIDDIQLSKMVVSLMEDDTLCIIHPQNDVQDSQIICSLGIFETKGNGQ